MYNNGQDFGCLNTDAFPYRCAGFHYYETYSNPGFISKANFENFLFQQKLLYIFIGLGNLLQKQD